MSHLPIDNVLPSLFNALSTHPQVLLQAPPGAGKSTWLPLKLLEQSFIHGKIVMLEPRRLAARNVAQRLAQQLGEPVGLRVGYRMRSDSQISAATRLEVVTEGVLVRMIQQDPALEGIQLVILDEFHERSLQADLSLALLLDIQQGLRDDLKLLIMSATLDNQGLARLLPLAEIITAQGRTFPIERSYLPLPAHERFDTAVSSIIQRLIRQNEGSMLVFLPGIVEIKRIQTLLESSLSADEPIDISPLYGALSIEEQQKAIQAAPLGRQKVVLATNIAETSLTIEGVSTVVDSGLERIARFDLKSGLTRLQTQRISKASMIQRAGRAGRLSPGKCWHLISKEQAARAAEQSLPEIVQADLTGLILELAQWGSYDITQLNWIDSPPLNSLEQAKALLMRLNIFDGNGRLSAVGHQVAKIGCEPRLAAMLAYAASLGKDELATAALLTAIIEEPPRGQNSDMLYWLSRPQPNWLKRAEQLRRRLSDISRGNVQPECAAYLLAQAFPDRIAMRRGQDGRYLLSNGIGAWLPEEEALSRASWICTASLLQGANNPDVRVLLGVSFDPDKLIKQLPYLVTEQTRIEWDEEKGSLRAWRSKQIGRLVLSALPQAKPSEAEIRSAILDWVRTQGLSVLPWDRTALQLRTRLNCVRKWFPEEHWPDVSDDALLNELEQWLRPALSGVKDKRSLAQINLADALNAWLDWPIRQRLALVAPVVYEVPTGSQITIRYDDEKPPVLSVRLQAMFGERQSPHIAEGRIGLILELLSPAHRPLQITQDLTAFWQGAYREVQKEMKGRYPKHVWPDDPANALPTRKTKRFQPR